MTKLRNTCLFYIVVIIIAPALLFGFNRLFGNTIISIILTVIIIVPLLFVEGIVRLSIRKNRLRKQKFLLCPRCNIPVEKEPGICPSCGNQL